MEELKGKEEQIELELSFPCSKLTSPSFPRRLPVMLSNLYVYQGVLLAITNDPDSLPQITRMLSGEEEDSGHRGPAKAGETRLHLDFRLDELAFES